ncbi:hypothetical protein PPYR_08234 [Photinus pyralis]|uniref:15-hydroxyprostaglandin dehydrogenase n=1 Tax=Photinus pyralis TaxID=7054 RepID=A0A1Y1K7W8_PHOPY|nr:15-hydroxyprostaglandin dehydrogenase [NAD(+)]-like [Photinus pyralis]KAB0797240.1 hypothetical protein PPYR_08234 [Photinus pyralis]
MLTPASVILILYAVATLNYIGTVNSAFTYQGKIALVTGGSQGIGYEIIRELLRNGLKGVTLVDVNEKTGRKTAKEFNQLYAPGKVIFIPADVSNGEQFENAFKIALYHWKRLDIVVNNAAVFNENTWKMQVDVNVVGTLQGTLLGFEYMSKAKGGSGGTIINIGSIAAIDPIFFLPFNSATKSFVVGLGRALGHKIYYDYNEVRVITLCPGTTNTSSPNKVGFRESLSNELSPYVVDAALLSSKAYPTQASSNVAKGVVTVLNEGGSGSVWVVENDEPAYEIDFPERESMRKEG